jgi:hypothetical protein
VHHFASSEVLSALAVVDEQQGKRLMHHSTGPSRREAEPNEAGGSWGRGNAAPARDSGGSEQLGGTTAICCSAYWST